MSAATAYGVDLLVELAVGRSADAGLWATSTWGGTTRWSTSATPLGDWLDVTCDVLDGVRLSAGSNTDDGVTRRWESASAGLTLSGDQWDPWNGPHAGVVGDRTPVRISWRTSSLLLELLAAFGIHPAPDVAGWIPAFTGYVATRGYSWDPADQVAKVACVDGTSVLVASDRFPVAPQGAGETAAQRVARVAAAALWAGGTDITAGGTPLQATTLDEPAWSELLEVADTDLALMWVTRAGVLAYRPRGRVGAGVALSGRLVVCEVDVADVAVLTLERNQPSITRNRVSISRRADPTIAGDTPARAVLEDRESIARYQAHDFKRDDLWHVADAWSTTVAEAVLASGTSPSLAPGQAVLDSITGDPMVAPLLLSLEPDQSFDVVDDAGTVYRQAVIGWDVELRNDEITGTLLLEDITRWTRVGSWGTAKWAVDRWGLGGT